MLFEFISLVYGQLIIRLRGLGCQICCGANGSRLHACGFVAATALNCDHSSPMRRTVFVRRLACRDPQRLLEHRIDVGRAVQFDPDLRGPGHRHAVVGALGHRNRLVLARPVRLGAACPQSCSGTPGFGAGDQHDVGAAGLDVQARLVDQRLRDVAADAGVAGRGVLGAGCAGPAAVPDRGSARTAR